VSSASYADCSFNAHVVPREFLIQEAMSKGRRTSRRAGPLSKALHRDSRFMYITEVFVN